ncbi:MAG: Fic family protein [Phycisphaerales bacterium]|nr:Fic family protein [Phycisphaerales bacterium]
MNPDQFTDKSSGKLVPITLKEKRVRAGKEELVDYPTRAFVPNPLPPELDWDHLKSALFDLHSEALLALGEINGLHKRVGNGATLLRALWMREAKMSSAVEGIETTAEDMVLAGAGREESVRGVGLEGWNYVKALEHGVSSGLPLCSRLICEMHSLLLTNVRGEDKRPGELRDQPVYIGNRERGPRASRYVPPPPGDTLIQCLKDFECFANAQDDRIPALFAVALMHYQFESIHPFRDGNGRIGRVLISRSLVKERLLEHPAVYMSAYINEHKREYVDSLLAVSVEGAWQEWIEFVLRAITTQAKDSILRSGLLIDLREEYQRRLKEGDNHGRLFRLIDRLFELPAINAQEAGVVLDVKGPTVYSDLKKMEEAGIITEYTGRKRDRDWMAMGVMQIIKLDHIEGLSVQDL